jgi:hypothetical protein
MCRYLDVLNEFATKEPLTDSMVLDICSVTVPTFFMEGGSELQLHALNVVRTVHKRITSSQGRALKTDLSLSLSFTD